MGFVKDAARVGAFGLAGLALSKNKKKVPEARPQMLLSNSVAPQQPTSMIGSSRGVI